jgi:hypothetical protein
MCFEILKSKDLRLKNTSGKVCRVRVTGAPMTIQEVGTELECVIPGSDQLAIEAAGDGIFRVVLPSKADMARLRKIKGLELENSVIYFEEWSSKQVDKWGLYHLWVRVSGCPDTLCRDYLAIFALGSLVGKAKEIDMKFTREHGIVRARINCANPRAIPRRLDHYYDGEGFAVYFDVEGLDGSVVPACEFDIDHEEGDEKGNASEMGKNSKPEENTHTPTSESDATNG